MEKNSQEVPEILKYENKEKFRRKLLILSRILAFLLILSIFYFGFEQAQANKENAGIMAKYGNEGYCYLCGTKAYRTCGCAYIPDLIIRNDQEIVESFIENMAFQNTLACENINDYKNKELNISFD